MLVGDVFRLDLPLTVSLTIFRVICIRKLALMSTLNLSRKCMTK